MRMERNMMEIGLIAKWMAKVIFENDIGVFHYKNNEKYEGELKNGLRNGYGN